MVLAVPAPGQFITGVDATAAFLNSNVHDAVTFLTNPPHCVTYASSVQAIPNATWTAILFQVNVVDSYSGHSTTTNTSRYVAQVPGWYLVRACAVLTVTTVSPALRLAVNGTAVLGSASGAGGLITGTGLSAGDTQQDVFLNAGDYVEGNVYQSSGSAANTSATGVDFTSSLNVLWVHA